MNRLSELTIKEFHAGLLSKEFSAIEAVEYFFNYLEEKDQVIGAYLSLNREGAKLMAQEVDAAIAKGEKIDSLGGVPLAVKDNILIKGLPATAAAKILERYVAVYDATVISRLKKRKAVFLGKTNLDEFAMGSSTENSAFQLTRNPYDTTRVPGGSSGGSAAAVAAGTALAALGSDTGGSIRQPAAFCGVVGLKPTYGAVSRYGLIALASSLDQIGVFGKTVEDTALVFQAIAGFDERDSTSAKVNYGEDLLNPELDDLKKLTVGIPDEYFSESLDQEVADEIDRVIKDLGSLGLRLKPVSLPHTKYALSVYYIVMPAEASTNLARFDGLRYGQREKAENLWDLYYENKGAGYGPETKRRIILGTFVLSAGYYDAYYLKAQRVRRLIKEDFENVFKSGVDVILAPTTPTLPFKIGERVQDPLQMYFSDILTIPVNLAGLPSVSLPVRGRTDKLPVGFQLIGKPWREADILGIGRLYEKL